MASSPNLSNPNHVFDKTKQYNKVVFQQGKPILDVDLNDMSAALQAQATSALIEKMGYGPSQLDYREWAMTAVDGVTPLSNRNKDNFAFTLGRLDTRKGVIDTSAFRSADGLSPSIIFDYGKIEDNTATDPNDRPYENYLFKGVVSSSTTTKIVDNEKAFSQSHRLGLINHVEAITPSYGNVASTTVSDQTRATEDHVVLIRENACRLRFLTGNLAGQEFGIQSAFSGNINVNLTEAADVGSEYIILPPNTLEAYRAMYDAAVDQAASKSVGLEGLPRLVTYVQVFEEDISSSEDSEIQSTTLGFETTHRSQLRWCVRVAMVNSSIDNDPGYAGVTSALGTEHIFALLADNKFVDYQVLLDSVDANASLHNAYAQSQFWAQTDSTGAKTSTELANQESPYSELGLTPMHFFGAEENTIDRMYWSFLKALLLKTSGSDANDFVLLNVFNSESKSFRTTANLETLSEYFVPGAQTDNDTQPIVHAWLSTGSAFKPSAGATPGMFKAPPRVFHTQADLSADNMKSRTLHGLRGGVIYGQTTNTPLVFSSVNSHLSLVDQMLLGLTGLGSAQGQTSLGERIPSAIDFTLANTTASLAQSGTGLGAVKMISPISAATITAGTLGSFLTGSASYLLRDKGDRASHTVNVDDSDLGWSLYKGEGANLVDPNTNKSDLTLRGWEEGMAQAAAFQQGLNFRKLAIKTTAHKSMDLFTISETPFITNNGIQSIRALNSASTAFQIPSYQSQDDNGNLFIDSYSGVVNDPFQSEDFNASTFIPGNKEQFAVKPLLSQYQITSELGAGGVTAFNQSSPTPRDLSVTYGPWNRLSTLSLPIEVGGILDNDNAPLYSLDLWSNRCTAMRLRYHVGDFYPGEVDSRGVPRNLLVDSMNLFMKVEPLSLAHWMTMPKHQHSILEGSLSFAEGIEALLKIAHGLGDTQKLINAAGSPLINANSPALTEAANYQDREVGDVDILNLPFGHDKHPFVHWYHPNMHKITAPHPNDLNGNTYINNIQQTEYKLTVYPKFGRRSLIVPALVPSIFDTFTFGGETEVPTTYNSSTGVSAFPTEIGISTTQAVDEGRSVDISRETNLASLVDGSAILPYPYHGTKTTDTNSFDIVADNGDVFVTRMNQITFPALGSTGQELAPTPVFIPASRVYARQNGGETEPQVGFNPMINKFKVGQWDDISAQEAKFPYDERVIYYAYEAGNVSELPDAFNHEMDAWSVPVLRAAISTTTVAGIVDLVRTSFVTGLDDQVLSGDYSFVMPTNLANNHDGNSGVYSMNQAPAIGPDNAADTLFVGDLGTALGGFSDRSGFMSPLTLGVPMRRGTGIMPNAMDKGSQTVRDSFEQAEGRLSNMNSTLTRSFTAINRMGLQQKLMWNCSFRVLHTRPGSSTPTAPKSLTEVVLAHSRTETGMNKVQFPSVNNAQRKPFIHLMSSHPHTDPNFPNKSNLEHLYPLVSDSTGGSHAATLTNGLYDYTDDKVQTSSMGDTFAVDPFDTMVNDAVFGNDNPLRSAENTNTNSGIEIDLLSELGMIHDAPGDYDLDTVTQINGVDVTLQQTLPTANELTLPGDHELVFVLYTGHYGAKMYDVNDTVNLEHIPPVAGCHLSATLEINRPSERMSSTAQDNVHYGVTMNSANDPINTYSIPSTK